MSHDLDDRIAATLQGRAGGEIDPEPLVRKAREHGARIRRRHRVINAVATAALTVTLTVAVLVTPDVSRTGRTGVAVPPPPATGVSGAAASPGLVGGDPATLHFTAAELVAGAESVTWGAGEGVESVEARGADVSSLFLLTRTAKKLDEADRTLGSSGEPVSPVDVLVADRPARVWQDGDHGDGGNWTVEWQPTGGLWARLQMVGSGQPELLAAAATLRFDAATRCALPFRLTVVPAGMRVLSCSVTLGSRGFSEGVTLVGDDERWFSVRVEEPGAGNPAAEVDGALTAGPYQVRRAETRVLQTVAGGCYVGLIRDGWGSWAKGVTEPEALSVLAGYRPAENLSDPARW
ncbi:hypothetical protein [Actinoplanes derwentensis]|uniref:Uncharacterized protein n=1 Tax=Actinoplanes derwentensis TaxID=113562 RepID=A0A1H2APJ6_9ACTN|nr:hypothetical protein [Actinoplanes derwentensis]GID84411.1 hypothetical protein Ade03nite_33350 [Actinoplanes derwentensis]SDT47824.1 hypothetical protein SAMN04489716_4000 [Actinoplanes derwentensis]